MGKGNDFFYITFVCIYKLLQYKAMYITLKIREYLH